MPFFFGGFLGGFINALSGGRIQIGSNGDDDLSGTSRGDLLIGRGGNDAIAGGNGNDKLCDGNGDDTVAGGAGNDTVIADIGAGDDDYSGGNGVDTLDYSKATQGLAIDLTAGTASGADIGTDAVSGFEKVIGGAGSDSIFGTGNLDETLIGGAGDDTIFAQSGNDLLDGGNGNDVLHGNSGADRILGGNGEDSLRGDAGTDTLTGGQGPDYFRWAGQIELGDVITDFNPGTASTTVDTLRFGVSGDIDIGNDDTVVDNLRKGNDAAINQAGTEVGIKTDASVATAAIQATIDGYGAISNGAVFIFRDATLGNAVVYYDANPSAAGGAVLVAELDNITSLAALNNFDAGDFLFG